MAKVLQLSADMVSTLASAFKLFRTSPRSFLRRVKCEVLPARSGRVNIGNVGFDIDLELDPVMRKMYFNAYQPALIAKLQEFLGEGDSFLDVGANVGYVSAWALSLVGTSGEVHAFEPVPEYYDRLIKVGAGNPGYRFFANEAAAGSENGEAVIAVSKERNIGWNTMVPGFLSAESAKPVVTVKVLNLSEYCAARAIKRLRLIKIDTEGFELPVLRGLAEFLRNTNVLPVIIVEVAPAAYSRLSENLSSLDELMTGLGYHCRDLESNKPVRVSGLTATTDVVFLPA